MRKQKDGEYCYIMNYQDSHTKFTLLRPLKTDSAREVDLELIKGFSTFGAPFIITSNKENEFCSSLCKDLAEIWPGMKLLYGPARCPYDEFNEDVINLLGAWMNERNTEQWASLGVGFTQYNLNRVVRPELGKTPHEAMFAGEFAPKI